MPASSARGVNSVISSQMVAFGKVSLWKNGPDPFDLLRVLLQSPIFTASWLSKWMNLPNSLVNVTLPFSCETSNTLPTRLSSPSCNFDSKLMAHMRTSQGPRGGACAGDTFAPLEFALSCITQGLFGAHQFSLAAAFRAPAAALLRLFATFTVPRETHQM